MLTYFLLCTIYLKIKQRLDVSEWEVFWGVSAFIQTLPTHLVLICPYWRALASNYCNKIQPCFLFMSRIRRMGKVLFSQVCVHIGGEGGITGSLVPDFFSGLWSQVLSRGYPSLDTGPAQSPFLGPTWGYPLSRLGGVPHVLAGGYQLSWLGEGYPKLGLGTGVEILSFVERHMIGYVCFYQFEFPVSLFWSRIGQSR